MDYLINKKTISIIGIKKDFKAMNAFQEVPQFWQELSQSQFFHQELSPLLAITINDEHQFDVIHYFIGTYYYGQPIPQGMEVHHFPEAYWVQFSCKGPYPSSMQQLNYEVYNEWFTAHPEYDIAFDASIEELESLAMNKADFHATLLLPLIKKS